MTTHDRDLDLDRLLDHWFVDGPSEAPDRLLEGVVGRIGRERQRPAWRLGTWRRPAVSRAVRLIGVAAALVAIVAISAFLAGGGPAPLPVPTPTASPTPTPVPSPQTLVQPTSSLAAGTYAYMVNGGGTTFSVPDGWRVPTFGPLDFSLAPAGAAPDDTVRVFYDMRVAALDDACSERPEPGIESSAAAIVAALAANPDLEVSAPTAIAIGGLPGLQVDVRLAPSATRVCPFNDGVVSVPLVVDTVPTEGPFWGVSGTERQRLIVIDHPTTTNVVLLIDSIDGTTFDALVEAAMPVLETFRFD